MRSGFEQSATARDKTVSPAAQSHKPSPNPTSNSFFSRFKATDAQRLRAEYNRLVEGLAQRGTLPQNDQMLANPALPDDILKEAVPGNIRRAEHFLAFLKRFVQYLKRRMGAQQVRLFSTNPEVTKTWSIFYAPSSQVSLRPVGCPCEKAVTVFPCKSGAVRVEESACCPP
jgi:hypothetical protein